MSTKGYIHSGSSTKYYYANGMSILYHLNDGSFLVYDGGNGSCGELLYKTLKELSGGDVKISAWVITHAHGDHFGALNTMIDNGLTDIEITAFLVMTTIARIPSILTSTLGGNALGSQKYVTAIIVFAVTLIISGAGLLIYNKISNRKKN